MHNSSLNSDLNVLEKNTLFCKTTLRPQRYDYVESFNILGYLHTTFSFKAQPQFLKLLAYSNTVFLLGQPSFNLIVYKIIAAQL